MSTNEIEALIASSPRERETTPTVADLLARGFAWLRFPEPLESRFRADHRAGQRRWVRLSLLVALLTTTGFALIDTLLLHSQSNVPNYVRFGLQFPAVLVSLLVTAEALYTRYYDRLIEITAPLFGIGSVLLASYAQPEQQPLVGARLLLAAFFFYFLLGMRLRQALAVNAVVFVAFAVAGLMQLMPLTMVVYDLFALFCANIIGAAGAYALEHANRTAFLEKLRLEEVATHDGLTGLLNRTAFEHRVREAWTKAASHGHSVTVILIDVDEFKRYNDHYGHQAGDECLRRVAQAVRESIARRSDDFVARYGGEELVAVLRNRDGASALQESERLVNAVSALGIEHEHSAAAPVVTISVGAATERPVPGSSHDHATKIADRALYTAKRSGRNRAIAVDLERPDLQVAQSA